MFVFITLFFFLNPCAKASNLNHFIEAATEKKLWQNEQWLRLLHYKKTVFTRQFESQSDSADFFISPDGKTNPEAEMLATLKGFYNTTLRKLPAPKAPQTIRCQLPARFRFLSKNLGITDNDIPKQDCTEFTTWKNKIRAKSATLVFSSYYLNNPSSAFGHSLLRLNRDMASSASERSQLLDYGINYAANATTSNPLLHAIFGLSGFYHGEFSSVPYYYKVREYNDFESRDLWEFDLNLSEEEIEMLVEHIWELGSTYFDYFYLTENCSYHMLTALEAISAKLNLTKHLPFWIIPGDTIKSVYRSPGLVKSIQFRPSIYTQLTYRFSKLKYSLELNNFEQLISGPTTNFEGVSESELDTALDFLDFKYGKELLKETAYYKNWKQNLLIARSRLPSSKPLNIAPEEEKKPFIGHDSLRIGLGYFKNINSKYSLEPSIRFALHDLLDPIQGYPAYAKIEFFNIKFRYEEELQSLTLHQWLLFSVDSLSNLSRFEKSVSWRLQVGLERIQDNYCISCLPGVLRVGAGYSWSYLNSPSISQYFLLTATTRTSPNFPDSKFSINAGPVSGLRFILNPKLIAIAEAQWLTDYYSAPYYMPATELNIRWAPNFSWAVNLGYKKTKYSEESGMSVFSYF